MANIRSKIEEQLQLGKEKEKKQISLLLEIDRLKMLDNIVMTINQRSPKSFTRNALIEMAIDSLIEESMDVFKQYHLNVSTPIKEDDFDLVILPAHPSGEEVLLNQHKWFYARLDARKIPKLKYIAIFFGSPINQVPYVAKIKPDGFEQVIIDGKIKYIIHLEEPITLKRPLGLGNASFHSMRSPRYTSFSKLTDMKDLSEL